MNEEISAGEFTDRLWVFMKAGNYNKHACAVNQLLPIRKSGESVVIGYLLISVSIATTNDVID